MKISQTAWVEIVNIINYEFVRTRTPITPKLLQQAITEVVAEEEEEDDPGSFN